MPTAEDGRVRGDANRRPAASRRRRRSLSIASAVGATLAVLATFCWLAPSAIARAPLSIAAFGLHTTRATHVLGLHEDGEEFEDIVNEPYAEAGAGEYTQAGGHPWAITNTLEFGSEKDRAGGPGLVPTQEPKDIVVSLPPGLLGDPMATPSCPLPVVQNVGACPADTQVGVYRVAWFTGNEAVGPIVNVRPERGQTAEFAFENTFKVSAVITGHLVRTTEGCAPRASCYGLTVASNGIPAVTLYRAETTFWGVPADPSHDPMRGLFCGKESFAGDIFKCNRRVDAGVASTSDPVPFLTMGTDCEAGAQTVRVRADSWQEPGSVVEQRYSGYREASMAMPPLSGCQALRFDPTIGVEPDTSLADEPVGLGVTVGVPQSELPGTYATPELRDAAVTLPEGMSVSPDVVDGIQACDESGPEGIDITGPESEERAPDGELQLASGHCPNASTVGTAEAITPLLPEPVRGHVYLARPGCGGPGQHSCTEEDVLDGQLYKLYLELGGTGELGYSGVHIKVEGNVHVNPATGQLTTTFDDNPQTPFRELKIHLNGGPRASLANPAVCGPAVTTSDFTPWSAPGTTPEGLLTAGTPDATPSSFFGVAGCSSPAPFEPSVVSGMVAPLAGQFSSFTMNLARQDREQYVKGIQIHTPPGLLGMLSSVSLCGDTEAEAGSCPAASKIGTTRVATGAGSHPFEIEGDVYLTGPYRGDPFGLSIVVHVDVGPFHLGNVVVRARIAVDPIDSTLTVTTDETGPRAVPQIVFGVPVRLRRITVDIDRPGFMFNPTDCGAQQIVAVTSGSQDATSTSTTPFAVGGCKNLAFKPHFTVSTSGHTSRSRGASLDAKLSYPASSVGTEANIARVKVSLPRQLPSRLPTLQKACPAAVFARNPIECPKPSIVGVVRARTPLLPVGLAGPVYFVSHGGEQFPDLVVVLQGDGVRVDLTGKTFIDKKNVTSTTFNTVPDVPVGTFELYLPEGTYSALGANTDLCKVKGGLRMPTEFVAQNRVVLKQSTKIAVTGCAAKRRARRAGKGSRARGAHNKKGSR